MGVRKEIWSVVGVLSIHGLSVRPRPYCTAAVTGVTASDAATATLSFPLSLPLPLPRSFPSLSLPGCPPRDCDLSRGMSCCRRRRSRILLHSVPSPAFVRSRSPVGCRMLHAFCNPKGAVLSRLRTQYMPPLPPPSPCSLSFRRFKFSFAAKSAFLARNTRQ